MTCNVVSKGACDVMMGFVERMWKEFFFWGGGAPVARVLFHLYDIIIIDREKAQKPVESHEYVFFFKKNSAPDFRFSI